MKLAKLIAITALTAFNVSSSFGQAKDHKLIRIDQIKKIFRSINDYKNYKVVTIDDSEEFLGHGTDNGGSLKGYYRGDSLKKIAEWVGLSNRVIQNEYYFDKGKLVFVYSTDSQYKFNDSTGEFDYSKFDKIFKGRYYFSNDKLLDTILNDKEHEKTRQGDAKDFLTSGRDYMKLLNARRK